MSKALEAGQWCKPRNEQEWKAVLDLAGTMGLGGHETGRSYPVAGGLGGYKLVSVISDPFRVVGCHYSLEGCLCVPSKKLSVPDFIAGMYALSEEKSLVKKMTEESVAGFEKMMKERHDAGPALSHEDRINRLELFRSGTTMSAREIVLELGEAKNRIRELEEGNVILDKEHVRYMRRTERLEAAFNEHLVKERENKPDQATKIDFDEIAEALKRGDRLFLRNDPPIMKEVMKLRGWDMAIDPKASPKDIPFEVALAYLKAGRKVTQAHWDDDTYLTVEHGCIIVSTVRCRAFDSPDDAMKAILANDWLVLPE